MFMTSPELDRILEGGLRCYVEPQPRQGLEERILRRVRAKRNPLRAAFPWLIAAAAALAMLVVTLPAHHLPIAAAELFSLPHRWCEQLQESWVSTAIRESTLMFPLIEGTHLLALALMIAPVMMFDLRLIGAL